MPNLKDKKNRKLVMELPEGLSDALSRRHNGRKLLVGKLVEAIVNMKRMYKEWQKTGDKLNWLLDVYWEEKNIEGHFEEPIFYGAHRRLRNLEKKKKEIWKNMFYLLLLCDDNYEQFDSTTSMTVEEIFYDFERKYIKPNITI
jgi:hypothetical protein